MSNSTNPKDLIGQTKPPLHLIPPSAAIVESLAMGLGAKKYGPFNWRGKRVSASVYKAAAERHLAQYWDGEDLDAESGAPHLGHARACLAILIDAEATGNLVDDRPPKGAASSLIKKYTRTDPTIRDKRAEDGSYTSAVLTKVLGEDPRRPVDQVNPPCQDSSMHRIGGVGLRERRIILNPEQQNMYDLLVKEAGCSQEVAVQIAAGTTFANRAKATGYVYVAGPMRGRENFNFPAFDETRDRYLRQGWNVISPADIDRASGDENSDNQCAFARRDFFALLFLAMCTPKGSTNAVAFLTEWEKSTGARGEFAIAQWLGLNMWDGHGNKVVFRHMDLTNSISKQLTEK